MLVIAVDGPAGSGKSTVALAVARELGLPILETGAMYRAITVAALRRGVDLDSGPALAELAQSVALDIGPPPRLSGDPAAGPIVTVDGCDLSAEIRGPEVGRMVSVVAAHAEVRAELVRRQRKWAAAHGGGVVEGRDIGTVVFPDAAVKIFLTASAGERARRRGGDEQAADLARRDRIDSTRAVSPLRAADDATVVDTTGRPVADIVEQIVVMARAAAQAEKARP